jgi:hypothetical protein
MLVEMRLASSSEATQQTAEIQDRWLLFDLIPGCAKRIAGYGG